MSKQEMITVNRYQNGNATVTIFSDGSRTVEFEDNLKLEYPLNIDIRVSERCAFGLNPDTGKSICTFCHESAKTNGNDANLDDLKKILEGLPSGIELAVGANQITDALVNFLEFCKSQGYIVNLTVNQGHLKRDYELIKYLINSSYVKGLGISYRQGYADINQSLLDYDNTVVHVIAGIDTINEVKELAAKGVRKILILGEKDFGFNSGKVDTTSVTHRKWRQGVHELFKMFDIVSFDNLAVEQLYVKRFFNETLWKQFYQGEHSFYINAVTQTFSRSSRHPIVTPWSRTNIVDYFQSIDSNC